MLCSLVVFYVNFEIELCVIQIIFVFVSLNKLF